METCTPPFRSRKSTMQGLPLGLPASAPTLMKPMVQQQRQVRSTALQEEKCHSFHQSVVTSFRDEAPAIGR